MSKRYTQRQLNREASRSSGYHIHMLYLTDRTYSTDMIEARYLRANLIANHQFDKAEYAYGWALARADHHNPLPP